MKEPLINVMSIQKTVKTRLSKALRWCVFTSNGVAAVATGLSVGLAMLAKGAGATPEDAASIVIPVALIYVMVTAFIAGREPRQPR